MVNKAQPVVRQMLTRSGTGAMEKLKQQQQKRKKEEEAKEYFSTVKRVRTTVNKVIDNDQLFHTKSDEEDPYDSGSEYNRLMLQKVCEEEQANWMHQQNYDQTTPKKLKSKIDPANNEENQLYLFNTIIEENLPEFKKVEDGEELYVCEKPTQPPFLKQELFDAIADGELEFIKNNLDTYDVNNIENSNGTELLYKACGVENPNSLAILKYILECKPAITDINLSKLIFDIIKVAKLSQLKALIEYFGKDKILSFTTKAGYTPFLFACKSKQIEIVKYILGLDDNVLKHVILGLNALHLCIAANSDELVQEILEFPLSKSILEQGDKNGFTPLLYAIAMKDYNDIKNFKIIQLLLEYGANMSAKTKLGKTVQNLITEYNKQSVLVLLNKI